MLPPIISLVLNLLQLALTGNYTWRFRPEGIFLVVNTAMKNGEMPPKLICLVTVTVSVKHEIVSISKHIY